MLTRELVLWRPGSDAARYKQTHYRCADTVDKKLYNELIGRLEMISFMGRKIMDAMCRVLDGKSSVNVIFARALSLYLGVGLRFFY
jgi:hypothetical protein